MAQNTTSISLLDHGGGHRIVKKFCAGAGLGLRV
nr:MAG TPA: hypothetical protein [Caudoviricetes sp.]